MKVILVSQDRELYEICRGVLRQLSIPGPTVETPGSQHESADVTIWDLSSGPFIKKTGRGGLPGESGDLFVVSRQTLPDIQKLIPAGALGLLLKPVKRPVLHAFLSAALHRRSAAEGQSQRAKTAGDGRDDLLQALLEANVKLQESDQDRTNFLARALHDFRAPLTALQGYCDMLIRQKTGPLQTDQIDLLQRMQHSISRLSRMSRAMFELSIHPTNKAKPNLVKANIDNCIQNAIHQVTPIAQEKEITVTVDLDPPDTHLYLDSAAIEQVLVNLLENACKFTPRGGSIEIRGRLSYSNGQPDGPMGGTGEPRLTPVYQVELQDTGMGISPEHLDSIFEEFTSYAGARDRSGGGLGLAICRMLITAHKGTIWAESDQRGTKISFTLPVQQDVVLSLPPTVIERTRAIRAGA
jgi:signal transduction histidine kinase